MVLLVSLVLVVLLDNKPSYAIVFSLGFAFEMKTWFGFTTLEGGLKIFFCYSSSYFAYLSLHKNFHGPNPILSRRKVCVDGGGGWWWVVV